MKRLLPPVICVVVSASLLFLPGCGPHESSVTGVVTLDGNPLDTGNVAFHPEEGGAVAYGSIGSDGSYRIKTGAAQGLKPGPYVVTVVANEDPPDVIDESRGEVVPERFTPEIYARKDTSPLQVTIQPGPNDVPLTLTSETP